MVMETMKTISAERIARCVEMVARCVEKRSAIPILGGVRVEMDEAGMVRVSGTDLELAIIATETGFSPSSVVHDVVYDCADLCRAIKAGKGREIELTGEGVAFGAARVPMTTYADTTCFPDIPTLPAVGALTTFQPFAAAIAYVQPWISPEESRFTLNALLVDPSQESGIATLVATNSHCMGRKQCDFHHTGGDTAKRFLIHNKAASVLVWLSKRKGADGHICIGADDLHIAMETRIDAIDVRVVLRKMTGNFPDWRRVWPDEKKLLVEVTFQRSELVEACVAVRGTLNKERPYLTVRVEDGYAMVTAKLDALESSARVQARTDHDGSFSFGIDHRYLVAMLGTHADKEQITMRCGIGVEKGKEKLGPWANTVMKWCDGTLIMPVRA